MTKTTGINWSKVKAASRLTKKGRVVVAEDKLDIVNRAIHELILLKKRRMAAGEPRTSTNAVQVEIDKLMKQKMAIINTEKYIQWMREKGVQ